ncbi:MAG: hypothetical protein IJ560_02270 [Alphaproteobacteria bacterium]|nr:hypothetical protein [Alphaproteobacteria bacterium]
MTDAKANLITNSTFATISATTTVIAICMALPLVAGMTGTVSAIHCIAAYENYKDMKRQNNHNNSQKQR